MLGFEECLAYLRNLEDVSEGSARAGISHHDGFTEVYVEGDPCYLTELDWFSEFVRAADRVEFRNGDPDEDGLPYPRMTLVFRD